MVEVPEVQLLGIDTILSRRYPEVPEVSMIEIPEVRQRYQK
jgi:hypothetical protein